MDWLQFVASIIGSLAWPAGVVMLVLLLRKPVTRALLELSHLKYKDLELDFGRELKQLELRAKAIDVREIQPPTPVPPRDSTQLISEAARLAEEFPEPAVAVAWQAVELEMKSAIERLGLGKPERRTSPRFDAELLFRSEAIDEETYDFIKRMYNLRNLAVHAHGPTRVSRDEAVEFTALATAITRELRNLKKREADA